MIGDVTLEQSTDGSVFDLTDHTRYQDVLHVVFDLREHLVVSLFLTQRVGRLDKIIMLGGDHDGVDALRTAVITVFHRHLTLGIRAEIGHLNTFTTDGGKRAEDMMAQVECQRHVVLGLIRGITEHHALVAGALIFWIHTLHALVDVLALLMNGGEHTAALGVELIFGFSVAYATYRLTCHFLQVDISLRLHLASKHHLSGCHQGLTCHLRLAVVSQKVVEHGVGNLVSHFVGMTFTYGF